MPTSTRIARPVVIGAACALVLSIQGADRKSPPDKWAENYNIPLWPEGKVPLANGDGPLDLPFLTVFMPPEGKRNGSSVIIAPGGSNIMLMYGGEGVEVAERFNDWGTAAFVLTYRLSPRYAANARVLDGKRAVQTVRARAGEWKLDPNKIGMAGFSAGSEISRATAAASGPGDPNSADPIERVSSRPDYLVLVYSVGRATPGEQLKDFPPTFLISAAHDRGPANGSAQLFTELNRAGAIAELHLYQKGRHGFGAATTSPEFSPWMFALQHFLVVGGFLPGEHKSK
jgi:acetyl esterase/lipase